MQLKAPSNSHLHASCSVTGDHLEIENTWSWDKLIDRGLYRVQRRLPLLQNTTISPLWTWTIVGILRVQGTQWLQRGRCDLFNHTNSRKHVCFRSSVFGHEFRSGFTDNTIIAECVYVLSQCANHNDHNPPEQICSVAFAKLCKHFKRRNHRGGQLFAAQPVS